MGKRTKKAPKQKRKLAMADRPRKLTSKGKVKHKRGDLKMVSSRNVSFDVRQGKGGKWIKTGERKCNIHTVCDCPSRGASLMGFLTVYKGGEPPKSNVAQEAFDYIYEQIPAPVEVDVERFLEIGHFESLATATCLSLEDLSLYLLAFAVDESAKRIYRISEKHFVAWMAGLISKLPRNAAPPTRENAYAPLFAAAHGAIVDLNNTIRNNEDKRSKFYQFLYNWCLKGNDASDRVDSAKELWSCFFSASPVSFTAEEARRKFTAYVCFPRINQWLDFITILGEKATESKSARAAVEQSGVSFDTWTQLLLFAQFDNYDAYDDEDSWPVTMDDFNRIAVVEPNPLLLPGGADSFMFLLAGRAATGKSPYKHVCLVAPSLQPSASCPLTLLERASAPTSPSVSVTSPPQMVASCGASSSARPAAAQATRAAGVPVRCSQ
ncbi:Cullin binding family protein [Leishmania donovani]|uniref:Defective in cullin neddylation protein n=1 Tax=Leishmania donovani TaxID=5661 RepID=A0A504XML0_LEIDO|nr:Cullin binding family protein [Leishmania donovani]